MHRMENNYIICNPINDPFFLSKEVAMVLVRGIGLHREVITKLRELGCFTSTLPFNAEYQIRRNCKYQY